MAQWTINEVAGLFGESVSHYAPGAIIGMRLENTGSGHVLVFAFLILCSFCSPLMIHLFR